MISPAIVDEVTSRLTDPELRDGRWEEVIASLMDNGELLVVHIEARDYYPGDVPNDIKKEINDVLMKLMPPASDKFESNWSVIFTKRTKMYDSMFANEF